MAARSRVETTMTWEWIANGWRWDIGGRRSTQREPLQYGTERKYSISHFRPLSCGDGVFGVAALGRGSCVRGERRDLKRCQSQSGDFADSVTAVQNLAADSTVHREKWVWIHQSKILLAKIENKEMG
jgi:hypothetical protein